MARTMTADRGSASLYFIALMTASSALVGLVVDGNAIQRARSDAFGLAAGAARAGAQQLDDDARAQGDARIDPAAAAQAAEAHLAAHDVTGQVTVTGDTVHVTVERAVNYTFFRPGGGSVSSTAAVDARQEPTP